MKSIILFFIFSITLVSCGPTKEECEAKQKADLAIQAEKEQLIKIEAKGYYEASDFNLPPGTVVNFTMDNDGAFENFRNGSPIILYIQIQLANGSIKSFPCDERTWYCLPTGGVLK